MGIYDNFLAGSMRDFVAEQCAKPAREQINILEELAILKWFAAEALQRLRLAKESGQQAACDLASVMVLNCIREVERVALSASRIQVALNNADMQGMLDAVDTCNRLAELVHEHLGAAQADKLEKAIRERLAPYATNNRIAGVDLTPDRTIATCLRMDLTVPVGPQDEDDYFYADGAASKDF
jgi:hypothetical protein